MNYNELKQRADEMSFNGVISIKENSEDRFMYFGGLADRSEERPNNHDTLFGIASGTKIITALGIGQLIDQGKLKLDSKACDIIDLGIDTYDRNITIKDLLSHRSGMPDYFDEELFEDNDDFELDIPPYKLMGPKDYFPIFPRTNMNNKPGEKFRYNNGAYVYLAAIIEEVSGLSFESYVRERIFMPLNINRAGVYAMNSLPKNCALGYYEEESSIISNIYKLPIKAGGDGGIFMTAEDMHKLWKGFFEGKIISNNLVSEFVKPHSLVDEEYEVYYGLGIWLKKRSEDFYEPYVIGSDAGVSFKSSYDYKTNRFKYIVSNTSEGVWDIIKEFNQC